MRVVLRYGTRWARNTKNIAALRDKLAGDPHGVYMLCDGSMPVYVGRGRIWRRIQSHIRGRKARYWDHFSWFAIDGDGQAAEIEALLLRMFPVYLRMLNGQRANFKKAKSCKEPDTKTRPPRIKMTKSLIRRKGRK
jgi:hypothetical protein